MDPMNVLQPNSLGSEFTNMGLESMAANQGWGVAEVMQANPGAAVEDTKAANPEMDKQRRAKSREFGMPMEKLGF